MQITRHTSITEPQFFGCLSAFVDALAGELNSAAMYLRKLEGMAKGGAFAFEMSFDRHRYGALTVLDRWHTLIAAFGPHLVLSRYPGLPAASTERLRTAEDILSRANNLVDAANDYDSVIVEACVLAFQSLSTTFAEEHEAVRQWNSLGPMLPEDFKQARAIFQMDLAAR